MPKRYLKDAAVRARYGGISAMTLWRWRQRGFPKPFKIGRDNLTPDEVLDAHDERLLARNAELIGDDAPQVTGG